MPLAFDNSYARLGPSFSTPTDPTPVRAPSLIRLNTRLLGDIGLERNESDITRVLAGNALFAGMEPVAAVYAGHQFGHFTPRLGDGRAILLGELITPEGTRIDLQLKGSGPTEYSRRGDGRSSMGPVLREYLLSEFMHAMGVPTTRALAAVATGETVTRESPTPGAVFTRVASSHIRVGTFEYFASVGDVDGLSRLCDYTLARHFPQASIERAPALTLLDAVGEAQASLIAKWMSLGFIHGVMNTDNMLVSGETIDYGPCAFLDGFEASKVFSSIDRDGRYRYEHQPAIAQWNIAAFARALLPLLGEEDVEAAQSIIDAFPERYQVRYQLEMNAKLGWGEVMEGDGARVKGLLATLEKAKADYTLTFAWLAGHTDLPYEIPSMLQPWLKAHATRQAKSTLSANDQTASMRAHNPLLIPRNHQIEKAIRAAEDQGDYLPFHRLADALERPSDVIAENRDLLVPPKPDEEVRQTFCGT